MLYRELLENIRMRVPARTYLTKHKLHGDIPAWLGEKLPLFGTEEGSATYVSSGGRNLIIEENGKVYRVKGADPKGTITRTVSASGKNIINDTQESLQQAPDPEYVEWLLRTSLAVEFPPYIKGKPWNFLTRANTRNSKYAFDTLAGAYERLGFSVPCRFVSAVEYPNLTWNYGPLHSIVFELPDAESDLRLEEYERQFMRHLQHASPEELREIKGDVFSLYEALCGWHAFECRIMAEAGLVPSPDSFLGQNYVLAHVRPGEIGISRVDHTSTVLSSSAAEIKRVSQSFTQIYNIPTFITQALEMARRGLVLQKPRYSGYFDAAFKYQGEIRKEEFSETLSETERFHNILLSRPEKPVPVPEELILSVFERIKQIKIDEEFEVERRAYYDDNMRRLRAQGITLDMLLAAANRRRT